MRAKLVASVVVALTLTLGWVPISSLHATEAAAAALPGMCNGRSDANLHITAQATGDSGAALKYFVNVASDATGSAVGSLIVALPGSTERLVVTDWCRVWQHQPGQPSSGSCGSTYPAGAITAHAVGTATLDGADLVVRTDVRQLASGEELSRIRYRTAASDTTEDDCESGWTKLPAKGWYPLDTFGVVTEAPPVGYQLAGRDGGVFSFNAPFFGSMAGRPLNQGVLGIAADPVTHGYWLVAADGGVFGFNAPFFGSLGGMHLNQPVVGMANDPPTDGYWLAASDGGVFALGEAPFFGSMVGRPLNEPVVGVTGDPATGGYWLVGADGGVFGFDAPFYGSASGLSLHSPVVGIVSTPTGHGYWLVAADGGVFAYGDAGFFGSRGGQGLSEPVVGMTATLSAHGYWLVAADGGVFTYGDAGFFGSTPRLTPHSSIAAMTAAT